MFVPIQVYSCYLFISDPQSLCFVPPFISREGCDGPQPIRACVDDDVPVLTLPLARIPPRLRATGFESHSLPRNEDAQATLASMGADHVCKKDTRKYLPEQRECWRQLLAVSSVFAVCGASRCRCFLSHKDTSQDTA